VALLVVFFLAGIRYLRAHPTGVVLWFRPMLASQGSIRPEPGCPKPGIFSGFCLRSPVPLSGTGNPVRHGRLTTSGAVHSADRCSAATVV
jgi:hypothetical protein